MRKIHACLLMLLIAFCVSCNSVSIGGNDAAKKVNLLPILVNDKVGYIDKSGKIIINPQFEYGDLFTDGLALVKSPGGKYGYINESGVYVVNPVYLRAIPFNEGLTPVVMTDSPCQYIDTKGDVKLRLPNAEYIGVFSEGLAVFYEDGKAGYINTSGQVVIAPRFADATAFSEGMAVVSDGVDKDGNTLYGFIDNKGVMKIPCQFTDCWSFTEGLAVIFDGKKYGFINKEGKYVINPQFDKASVFVNGLAWVKQDELIGYVDKTGKMVIKPQFGMAGEFTDNGLAWVAFSNKKDAKFGYIDKKGSFVINPQFSFATDFWGDIAFAGEAEDKLGVIDEKGTVTVNPQFKVTDEVITLAKTYRRMRSALVQSGRPTPRLAADVWLNNFFHYRQELNIALSTEDSRAYVEEVKNIMDLWGENAKEALKSLAVIVETVTVTGNKADVIYTRQGYSKAKRKLHLENHDGRWLVHFTRQDLEEALKP